MHEVELVVRPVQDGVRPVLAHAARELVDQRHLVDLVRRPWCRGSDRGRCPCGPSPTRNSVSLTQHMPWQLRTCVQYGLTLSKTPSLSGCVQSRIGPPSCETNSRPLASKHMLMSENGSPGFGFLAAISTRKSFGHREPVVAAAFPDLAGPAAGLAVRAEHLGGRPVAVIEIDRFPAGRASLLTFQLPSLTAASRDWPLGTYASRTSSPAGPAFDSGPPRRSRSCRRRCACERRSDRPFSSRRRCRP